MRSRLLLTLATLSLLVAACGNGQPADTTTGDSPATTTTAVSPTAPETTSGQPAAPGPGSGLGYVEVAGVRYDIDEVSRCEDLDLEVDLIASGSGITAFVVIDEWEGFTSHEFSMQGDTGVLFNAGYDTGAGWVDDFDRPLPGPPFEVDDSRVRGQITVFELDGGGEVDVIFDLPIPASPSPC